MFHQPQTHLLSRSTPAIHQPESRYFADVVSATHPLFTTTLAKASANYRETLGFAPLSIPPRFIVIHQNGNVRASAGVYFASEKDELSAENMTPFEQRTDLRAAITEITGSTERKQLAEITAFNVDSDVRNVLVKPLLGFVFAYLYLLNITATVNILNAALKRPIHQLRGLTQKCQEFGTPSLAASTLSDDMKRQVQEGYIRRLRPQITLIATAELAAPHIRNCANGKQLVRWGDTLTNRVRTTLPLLQVA